jgi:putative hydrolase of the HAD superfamily
VALGGVSARAGAAAARVVLLDALGTLLELEPPAPRLRAALAERGFAVSEAQAAHALGVEIAYYRAHHDAARDAASLADLRDRCTAVLAGALPDGAADVADLRGALLASLRFRPYPEVAGVLGALRAAGLRTVVVSNWDVSLHEALATTGLTPLVDAAISSAEAGAAKPAGAIFARALALAGGEGAPVAAGDAVHVGDDVAADVVGAQAAGIRPVLVARGGATPAVAPGVTVLPDLRALPELLTAYSPLG